MGSWADDMVHVAKNEMWASEVCFAYLTWPCGLLERLYHLQTHTPVAVDPHNFIERFWLGSVRSASQVARKVFSNEL